MDLDVERIAFGSVVGVTGAAVAAGTGRERNQQVNLGKNFDEIAGRLDHVEHLLAERLDHLLGRTGLAFMKY